MAKVVKDFLEYVAKVDSIKCELSEAVKAVKQERQAFEMKAERVCTEQEAAVYDSRITDLRAEAAGKLKAANNKYTFPEGVEKAVKLFATGNASKRAEGVKAMLDLFGFEPTNKRKASLAEALKGLKTTNGYAHYCGRFLQARAVKELCMVALSWAVVEEGLSTEGLVSSAAFASFEAKKRDELEKAARKGEKKKAEKQANRRKAARDKKKAAKAAPVEK